MTSESRMHLLCISNATSGKIYENFYRNFQVGEEVLLFVIKSNNAISSWKETIFQASGTLFGESSFEDLTNIAKRRVRGTKLEIDDIVNKTFTLVFDETLTLADLRVVTAAFRTMIGKIGNEESEHLSVFTESVAGGNGFYGASFSKESMSVLSVINFPAEEPDEGIEEQVEEAPEPQPAVAIPNRDYDPKQELTLRSVNSDNVGSFIKFFTDSTEYVGLNPKGVISKAFGTLRNQSEQATAILLSLGAYVRVGNNAGKLIKKRKNKEFSTKVAGVLSKMNVKRSSKTSDGVTLARLALCMPGELFLIRTLMSDKLQNQVSSQLSKVYQDLAFQGVPEVNSMTGYREYAIEFSSLIYRKKGSNKDDVGVTESEKDEWKVFQKNFDRWEGVAKRGYSNNEKAKTRFASARNLVLDGDKDQIVFNFLKESVRHYLG